MKTDLSKRLDENQARIDHIFVDCPDIIRQQFQLKDSTPSLIVFLEGMNDTNMLQRDILPCLMQLDSSKVFNEGMETVKLPAANLQIIQDIDTCAVDVTSGKSIVFINGFDRAISISAIKLNTRSISEPSLEKNVRGPHEAFIEAINTNFALLRRRLKNPKLKFKTLSIGKLSNQMAAIAYVEDLAKPEMVDMVYKKLESIDYDVFFDVGYLEQALVDNTMTPFPHFLNTERIDKAVSSLMEGKIAVFLDGSPSAMIMPMSFFSAFQAPDDYNTNWLVGSLNRLIRMTALLLAVFLPSLYIAIVSYHYYMVPLNLIVPLAESRAKVPFPPIVEVLILEFTIEMLREATIRLPTYIGTSIGIVGGLIIGQAAVQAGIVSNLVIIIVAVTALASYLIPNYDMSLAVRYCRFIVMFFAAVFGIIGVVICGLFLLAHLITVESLGEPYFKPLFPFNSNDIKDTWLRPSLKVLRKRPSVVKNENELRGRENGQ